MWIMILYTIAISEGMTVKSSKKYQEVLEWCNKGTVSAMPQFILQQIIFCTS